MTRRLVAELTAQRLATEALRAETSRTDAATAVALESLAVVRSNHRELVSQEDEYIRLCTCRLGCRSLDSQTSTHSHAQPDQLLSLWLTRARRPTYNAGTDSKRSAIMEAELKQRHAALQEVNRIEASFERRAEARKLIPQRVQVRGGVGRRPLAALCPFAALRSSPALPLT